MKECAFSPCWDSNVSGDVCVTRYAPFPWTNLISLTSYTVVIGGLFVEQLIIPYKSQYHCLKSERFYTSPAQVAYSRALFCRQMACLHVWCMWLFSPFSVLLILLYPADQRQGGAWAWAWSCSRLLPVKRDFFPVACWELGLGFCEAPRDIFDWSYIGKNQLNSSDATQRLRCSFYCLHSGCHAFIPLGIIQLSTTDPLTLI